MVKETSEIVKLTERVSKDPKSKLFVPLAEEYKKAGDLEMAVYVLSEGLKHNPGYITARSILGRLLLEQGDLAGAQRELEEVVKAIPDNLLAQRKLGDICIVQNNPSEALRHYKSVLALNPRDNEISAIIADIEAGRDVSQKLPQGKAKPIPEKAPPQEGKPQPSVASAPHVQQPRAGTPVLEPSAPPSRPENPETAKLPADEAAAAPVAQAVDELFPSHAEKTGGNASAAVPPPSPTQTEQNAIHKALQAAPPADESVFEQKVEEPEEILLVEPLEKESPDQESHEKIADFLSEQGLPTSLSMETTVEAALPSPDQSQQTPASPDLLFTEPDIFKELKITEEALPDFEQKNAGGETADVNAAKETVAPLDRAVEETAEKSDDFTTDTLAELYIAQGFYEKAIDIYERMLADNQNSKKLKEKLDRVRAMASAAVSTVEEEVKKPAPDIFAEPRMYSAQQEPVAEKKAVFSGEPGKEAPPAKREEKASVDSVGAGAAAKLVSPPDQNSARAKPLYTDFEPREYVPPETKVEEIRAEKEKVLTTTKSAASIRKETIHRLEAWLKNIKKET